MNTIKALMLGSPREVFFQEMTLEELKYDQVLLRSLLSTFKHGTEMSAYHGYSPFFKKTLNPQLRVFLENSPQGQRIFYPRPLGNMTVGVIENVGNEVHSLKIGDIVFGWLPVANWHVVSSQKIQPLNGLGIKEALCIDPASFALGAVLDGNIRYREKVLITGLGAIGLLAVQYCKLYGAKVYASSSFPLRRQLALEYGADEVLDSKQIADLGLEIKRITGGGVDVALECSGSYSKLHHTIRAVRQCGRVVCVGFYSGGATDLNLGEEFFHNRISLLASLPAFSWNNPVRGSPSLYAKDLQTLVIEDLKVKRLNVQNLLKPIYSFSQADKVLEIIAKHPEDVIKVGIEY